MKPFVENVFMRKWLSVFCLLIWSVVHSQDIPIGAWRNHFSFNAARLLENSGDGIFVASTNGLYHFHNATRGITYLSKQKGLSSVGVSCMAYSAHYEVLVVGYPSGLIDLVYKDHITTLPEVFEDTQTADKTMYDVALNGELAYLASGFGVIVVSLKREEIIDNYRSIGAGASNVTVFDVAVLADTLYAYTGAAIQKGSVNDNLLDFNKWKINPTPDLAIQEMKAIPDRVVAITDSLVLDVTARIDTLLQADRYLDIGTNDGDALVLGANAVVGLDGQVVKEIDKNISAISMVVQNDIYLGSSTHGLLLPDGGSIMPDGPCSDEIKHIRTISSDLYAFYSEVSNLPSFLDSIGYSRYRAEWVNEQIEGFYAPTDVASYQGSLYFTGKNGVWNATNDELLIAGRKVPRAATRRLAYFPVYDNDQDGLYVLDRVGELFQYSPDFTDSRWPVDVQVNQDEVVYLTRSPDLGGGISVLETRSDAFVRLSTSRGLPSNVVNGVAFDRDNDVWFATERGLVTAFNSSFVFDGVDIFEPAFENVVPFEGDEITAVSLDGGDRVWVANDSGIKVYNNNFTKEIFAFSTLNSPLPSNHVLELAYNDVNGEMNVLTDHGLVSVRSNSSGAALSFDAVNVFPNPVPGSYEGLVGISGLTEDAVLKVATVNGDLIASIQANGGTASWDLKDYNGRKVEPGVYVLLSATDDKSERYIGKLAVLR